MKRAGPDGLVMRVPSSVGNEKGELHQGPDGGATDFKGKACGQGRSHLTVRG